jgi:hypothetical protein
MKGQFFCRSADELINDHSLKLVENPLEKSLTSLYYKESIAVPHNEAV